MCEIKYKSVSNNGMVVVLRHPKKKNLVDAMEKT